MCKATLGMCSIQVAVQPARSPLVRFGVKPGRYKVSYLLLNATYGAMTNTEKLLLPFMYLGP